MIVIHTEISVGHTSHDDVMKWERFSYYCPFVKGLIGPMRIPSQGACEITAVLCQSEQAISYMFTSQSYNIIC